MFAILIERCTDEYFEDKIIPRRDPQLTREVFKSRLGANTIDGLSGLYHSQIERLLGRPHPNCVLARLPADSGSDGKQVRFKSHASKLWVDRVGALFTWGDDTDRKRSWDNEPFRQLTREYYSLFQQTRGRAEADQFLNQLKCIASERMLIILPYDHSRLSVLHKGSKHHGAKTREYIHSCSILDRTQWLAARMPQHQATVFRAFEGKLRRASFAPNSKPAEYSAMTTALRGVITSHLHEVSIQVPFSQGLPPIIRSPKPVALNARLVAARVFLEQLEKMGSLDSESSVDDGTSEDEQCF